jgi:hypothetical protein
LTAIALICTDDMGEYVLNKPEEVDESFDDMTLIVSFHVYGSKNNRSWNYRFVLCPSSGI